MGFMYNTCTDYWSHLVITNTVIIKITNLTTVTCITASAAHRKQLYKPDQSFFIKLQHIKRNEFIFWHFQIYEYIFTF